MNIVRKGLFAVVAAVLLGSAICHSQDIGSDFQQALAMVPQEPRWTSGIMYYDMQDAADAFVGKYADSPPVGFLEAQIQEPHTRKLALLCLAKLAPVTEAAQAAFYDVLYGKFGTQAVTAIAHLEPGAGRPIAETLVSQPGPWEVRKAAVELLVGLGDHDTLEMFQQLVVHEQQGFVKKALARAIIPLKHRLTHVAPREQADWAHWDTVCWRTLRETPLPRRVDGEKRLAAETLHMQGRRFPREYLEYKLSSADLLGIALIGLQKETWAVPGLKEYATLKGSLGDFSRSSLAKMGTSEALRALEDALIPGGYSRANTHLTMILEIYGDEASAEFMKNLSADQRFSEDERASFEHAYNIIVKRLADINGDGEVDFADFALIAAYWRGNNSY
jgi:hypothetical protein